MGEKLHYKSCIRWGYIELFPQSSPEGNGLGWVPLGFDHFHVCGYTLQEKCPRGRKAKVLVNTEN